MSELYIILNQPDSAIILLEKNFDVLNQMRSNYFSTSYYKILSTAYEKKGDIRSAFKYYKLLSLQAILQPQTSQNSDSMNCKPPLK